MPITTVKTTGFAELEKALGELPKATAKNTMRRGAKRALEPMRAKAASMAADAPPYGEGLSASLTISATLSPRTRAAYRREGPSQVFMHMGPATQGFGPYSKAVVNEFGSFKMAAHPYMRPAWDSEAEPTLDYLKKFLGEEVVKAAARAGRKQAKGG